MRLAISNDKIVTTPKGSNVVDGIIGFVSQQSRGKNKNSKSTQTLAMQDSLIESLSLEAISEINAIESSTSKSQLSRGKNKGKGESKQNSSPKKKPTKNEPIYEKQKPPCLIFNEDHYMNECPNQAKVSKFIKGYPNHIVLKDPFASQDNKMVSHNTSSSSASQDFMMMSS